MKVLFVTAHPYIPEMMGGMQFCAHEIVTRLNDRGHECAVLSGLIGAGLNGFKLRLQMKMTGKAYAQDSGFSYPVYRAWSPDQEFENVASHFKPDCIVVLAGKPVLMARQAQKTGLPVLLALQDVEREGQGGDFAELGLVPCIANSHFTAGIYKERFGFSAEVIHPIIRPEKYHVSGKGDFITMINPHPLKGLDLALKVADLCHDLPFLFVEGWPLNAQERAEFFPQIKARGNIRFIKPQKDMRRVYGQTKILIVPSRWEEAFGRVAAEAQISGIPVIASERGGLPESVGPGGFLMPPDAGPEEWAEKVRHLYSNEKLYEELSQKALMHSQRPAMNSDLQTDQWEKAIKAAAGI